LRASYLPAVPGSLSRRLTIGDGRIPPRIREIAALDFFADEALITDEMVEDWYQSVLDRDYVRFLLRVSRSTRDWRIAILAAVGTPHPDRLGRAYNVTPRPSPRSSRARSPIPPSYHRGLRSRPFPGTAGPSSRTILRRFLPDCFARHPVMSSDAAVVRG